MNYKNILIVCSETNVDLSQYALFFKIGVERGALDLIKAFNHFDLFCCDQDSISLEEQQLIRQKAARIVEYPTVKDEIDGEIAIHHALEFRPDRIVLVGDGHRFDMQISCLRFIYQYGIEFINDNNYAFLLKPGVHQIQRKNEYRYLSLFALKPTTVSIRDMKYNVDDFVLNELSTNAISNEFVGEVGTIYVHFGKAIIIYTK